jgi:hypothetical protein
MSNELILGRSTQLEQLLLIWVVRHKNFGGTTHLGKIVFHILLAQLVSTFKTLQRLVLKTKHFRNQLVCIRCAKYVSLIKRRSLSHALQSFGS